MVYCDIAFLLCCLRVAGCRCVNSVALFACFICVLFVVIGVRLFVVSVSVAVFVLDFGVC